MGERILTSLLLLEGERLALQMELEAGRTVE